MKYPILLISALTLFWVACSKAPKRKLYTKSETVKTNMAPEIRLTNSDSVGSYILLAKNGVPGNNLYKISILDSASKNMIALLRDDDVLYVDEMSTQIIDNRISFFLRGADGGTKTRFHEFFLFVPSHGGFVEASIKEDVATGNVALTAETYSKMKSMPAKKFMNDKIKTMFPKISMLAPSLYQEDKNLALR